MSQLVDLIQNQLSQTHYESMGNKIGASPQQTESAVSQALPLLVGALTNKASSNSGLNFLTAMLDKNRDGSVIDDIVGMVMGSSGGSASPQGQKAVQALLGSQAPAVEEHVAESSGLDATSVAKLLPMLAPMVMAALTKAQSSKNLSGQGLSAFLEKEQSSIAESSPDSQGILNAMFDKNHDGSVMDDMMNMGMGAIGNFFKK